MFTFPATAKFAVCSSTTPNTRPPNQGWLIDCTNTGVIYWKLRTWELVVNLPLNPASVLQFMIYKATRDWNVYVKTQCNIQRYGTECIELALCTVDMYFNSIT